MSNLYTQHNFRGRDDTTALNTDGGWRAGLSTNWSQGTGTTNRGRVRWTLWNNDNKDSTLVAKLQYYHTQGTATWTDVTASSSVVRVTDCLPSDSAACTAQLLTGDDPGSGAFENDGSYDEGDGTLPGWTNAKYGWAEFENGYYIIDADVSDNDTIQLRLIEVSGGTIDTYRNTPTITVNKPAQPATYAAPIVSTVAGLPQRMRQFEAIASGPRVTDSND